MSNRYGPILLSAAFCASLTIVGSAGAQTRRINAYSVHPQLGLNLGYLGEAQSPATLSNSGFGLAVNYRQPLDKVGIMAVRLEAAYAALGKDRTRVVEGQGTTSESITEVQISHQVFLLDLGFQLQVPRGILRPYVAASGGLAHFISSVTVTRQVNANAQVPDSSGMSDNSLAYSGTAGILLMISSKTKPVFLDAGFRVFRANAFDALLISDVGTNSGGTLAIPRARLPLATRYMLFIGVSFALH
jgi:hypothetical protein